jgi:peptidoglycan/LPS O-acetylase OafA/YrhL
LRNTRRIFCLLCLPIVVAPICRVFSNAGVSSPWAKPFFQPFSSLNHFDSLAIGCLTALLLVRHHDKTLAVLTRFSGTILFTGALFVVVPQMLIKSFVAESLTTPLGNTFQALGFALLLLQSIFFPKYFLPLNWAVVRQIGVLSYSIYIWQMLFCGDPRNYGWQPVWFMSFYGWIPIVLLVAACSYYCLEKPLMALRARFHPAPPTERPKIA